MGERTDWPPPVEDDFDFSPWNTPKPDKEVIRRHLGLIKQMAGHEYDDGLIEMAHDDPTRGDFAPMHARLFELGELNAATDFAIERNAVGCNVWVGAALKKPDTPREGRTKSKDHFYAAPMVPFDADRDAELVICRLAEVGQPLALVTTGTVPEKRVQGWLPLVEPCGDYAEYKAAFKALNDHVGGDDDARGDLMRLPGSVSFPPPKKQAKGYQTELTTVTVNPIASPNSIERLAALEPWRDLPRGDRARKPDTQSAKRDATLELPKPGSIRRLLLLAHLRDALFWVPADKSEHLADRPGACSDGSRKLWIDMGQGLSWFGDDGWGLWSEWSATSGRYDEAEARQEWLSFQPDRITWRSVFSEAQDRGWPNPRAADNDQGESMLDDRRASAAPAHAVDLWERWPTPAFPLNILPPVLAEFVRTQATSTGGDSNAFAMAVLTAASGAVSHSFRLKMKRTGDWCVRPRLWVALVGSPSTLKTPVIAAATAPLHEKGAQVSKAYRVEKAQWERAKKTDLHVPEPPAPRRLVMNDTTVEKLTDILSRQDTGVLVVRDELTGWLGDMEKHGNGKGNAADRAVWMESYNGQARHEDRIGRGETFVELFSTSMLGGIQPDKLDMLQSPESDGLTQRFLPVMLRPAERSAECAEADAAAAVYRDLIRSLIDLRPCLLKLDDAALEEANTFQGWIHNLKQAEGLGDKFISFLGKLTGIHGSLMLLLHLVSAPKQAPNSPVSWCTAKAASRMLKQFVVPHALAFYQASMDGGDWELIREIGSFILTDRQRRTRYVPSDFTAAVRKVRGLTAWDAARRISALEPLGWLIEEADVSRRKAWTIPPGLRERFAEQAKCEDERKARVREAIAALFGGGASVS